MLQGNSLFSRRRRWAASLLADVGGAAIRLPALFAGIERISEQREVMVAVIAHAGDANTHPLIVYDADDAAESLRASAAFGEIMDLAISLGARSPDSTA